MDRIIIDKRNQMKLLENFVSIFQRFLGVVCLVCFVRSMVLWLVSFHFALQVSVTRTY